MGHTEHELIVDDTHTKSERIIILFTCNLSFDSASLRQKKPLSNSFFLEVIYINRNIDQISKQNYICYYK